MASIIATATVAFATGILVGIGLNWRRYEALRSESRTQEEMLDTYRGGEIQRWLDAIGPVTPPSSPAVAPGLVLFDQDAPPDDPSSLFD